MFDYHPSGGLICLKSDNPRRQKGDVIFGKRRGHRVKFDGKNVPLHRLIWMWHYGDIPDRAQIDHINRDWTDNRIENLRVASASLNQFNKPGWSKNNYCPGVGPSGRKNKPFFAVIGSRHLGRFVTLEEALRARLNAEIETFGETKPETEQCLKTVLSAA